MLLHSCLLIATLVSVSREYSNSIEIRSILQQLIRNTNFYNLCNCSGALDKSRMIELY